MTLSQILGMEQKNLENTGCAQYDSAVGYNQALDNLDQREIDLEKLRLLLANWCISEGLSDLPIRPLAQHIINNLHNCITKKGN